MERKKTLDIVISFLIALVLWFYVINIVNPQKDAQVRYVPVNISGVEALEERGLAIVGDLDYKVNLKIVASRNDIANLTAQDFTASADVASLNKGDTYIQVKVAAPRGITIEDIDSENIEVVVEDFITDAKPIGVNFKNEAEGKEVTIKHFEHDTINVCGARSDVNKVSKIIYELDAQNLTADNYTTLSLAGQPCDKAGNIVGGIKLLDESLKVDATVYSVKTVKLDTPIDGIPAAGELAIENYEIDSVITIKGPASVIEKISTITAQPISIDGITETTDYTLMPILPDGVYQVRGAKELKATVYIAEPAEETSTDAAIDDTTEVNN
ncbi:MAG: CdaR family protein [Bacillota bacterium]|nr:CdaR family protein [Bacillota bacterium]